MKWEIILYTDLIDNKLQELILLTLVNILLSIDRS